MKWKEKGKKQKYIELKNSRKLGKVNEWERSIGKRKNEIIERKKWKRLNEGIKCQQKMRKNWKNKIFKNWKYEQRKKNREIELHEEIKKSKRQKVKSIK